MSDDLVTRLRRAVIWNGVVPHGDFLAMEAADEIERNRATMETQATLISDMRGEIERLKALLAGYEAMENSMKHEAEIKTEPRRGWA